jgi:hypothetical protein
MCIKKFGIPFAIICLFVIGLHLVSCGGSDAQFGGGIGPPPPPPPTTSSVTTFHNDNARTGQNLNETTLTPANVSSSNFGLLFLIKTEGKVDAQPLYVPSLTIAGQGTHNVLLVATEQGIVYGFDADSGTQLWKVSTLAAGESTSEGDPCGQVVPEIGVTSTPVIDPKAGPNGTMYVVAMSKDANGNYHQRLHALDITSGAEEFGGPKEIQASYPGTGDNSSGGNVIFDPGQQIDRPALLLLNGVVYTSWGSHCDIRPYTGWLIGYDESTLAQITVLNVTPNGSGGALWMSGAGPAADDNGNIYALDANGVFDSTLSQGFPSEGDFGNAFLKISTTNNQLAVADYFEMMNQASENSSDTDLGSGGALVLPDLTDNAGHTRHLAVGAGKDAIIYVVDRDSMGKFNPNANNIYQQLQGALGGSVFSMPAYFNNTVYYGAIGDAIKAFPISSAQLNTTPSSQTPTTFPYPGTTPSISVNNTSNAILWAAENAIPAVLHAYDATNLAHELYNSNQASGGRDHFGTGNKFITPTVINGKVYVGSLTGVGVFGLKQQ